MPQRGLRWNKIINLRIQIAALLRKLSMHWCQVEPTQPGPSWAERRPVQRRAVSSSRDRNKRQKLVLVMMLARKLKEDQGDFRSAAPTVTAQVLGRDGGGEILHSAPNLCYYRPLKS